MKDREQFELDKPTSLRTIVIDELQQANYEDAKRHREVEPITDEGVEALMQKVYAKIEREALSTYHSAEPWALRQWALSNILKDEVVNEATAEMAHGIISDVIGWQEKQPFDPIGHFKKQIGRKSYHTQRVYLITAARFVAKEGRKSHYTEEEIEDYQLYAQEKYKSDMTYYHECQKLLAFLRSLPGGDKNRKRLPLEIPKKPRKRYRPIASPEDIESLIWSSVLDNVRPNMVVRLAAATVYGRRIGELTDFSITLDGDKGWITFPMEKDAEENPHPIPEALIPLFKVPVRPLCLHTLRRNLKKICRKAGVYLPPGAGYHWIRRRVATVVRKACGGSDIDAHRFMRWSEPRELSMLALYDEARYEETDEAILAKHPFVKMWEEATPYVFKFNPAYQSLFDMLT